jgi:hypothetical protein
MRPAVLLMMHQGNSFTQEASEILERKGISLIGLSSRPESEKVFERNKAHLADWLVVEAPQLAREDVTNAVSIFGERGYAILAGLATFEGYRLLMAEVNAEVGAHDSSCSSLRHCLNKLELRRFLFARQLSKVRCYRLNANEPPRLDPEVTWFVKPVRGAASFASFILQGVDDLKDVPTLQAQMKTDPKMSAIFMDQYDFLVEEYIEGPEFSFEAVAAAGAAYQVCVHEKAKMERQRRTTLEAMSISPPISIDSEVLLAGAQFVSACLSALELDDGAFHVEAKYWTAKRRWEIIEINPRMGGSLINASVKAVTGSSMLELWIDSLLAKSDSDLARLKGRLGEVSQLETLRQGTTSKATVFLSKYGAKGRTVESIGFSPPERKPAILKMHVEQGTELENSDRALCLMDALWQVDYADLAKEVDVLDRLANEHFLVEYR